MNTKLKIKIGRCYYSFLIIVATAMFFSCDGIYDNIKEFSDKEIIYPPTFDTCFATIGYERAEIDLRIDGRLPSSKINHGTASKTVVIYDEGYSTQKILEIDSVCSFVNVTGLNEPRIYRFKIFTEDKYGNRSIPKEISLVPYTSFDLDVLKQGILDPTLSITPNSLVMEWPTGLNTIMMEYHGLNYEYTDSDGDIQKGDRGKQPRIYIGKLSPEEEVVFNMKYRVLPILDGGKKLLDTIEIVRPFHVMMPSADQPFVPQELQILKANGVDEFTSKGVEKITTLTYPMNMTTFADLFYFPNVSTLNLTGKGLDGMVETLQYNRFKTYSIVGGGVWQEFMMPVDKPNLIRSPESLQTLKDLIESGQITKIQYIPKSMGLAFDQFLAPYVDSGVVELLTNDHPFFPNHVFIEPQFYGNGKVQYENWETKMHYSGDFLPREGLSDIARFDPNNDVVNGQSVNLQLDQLIQNDGKNIYRVVVVSYRPSFFFALPREWRYDNTRYPYLKFKMFIGSDKSLVSNVNGNNRHMFRYPWIRPMNYMWAFTKNSDYGSEYWNAGYNPAFPESKIQNSWHEYTIDLSRNDGGDTSNKRNRVYVFNLGEEKKVEWNYDLNKEVVIYFADIRLCKTRND